MKKSKLGYKRYSPDVRKPYNVIPSGRITMQDVDFPVYGVDDMGNAQMMYPGGEYQFPGNEVFELPVRQVGGQRDTIYTSNPNDPRLKAYQDSLYVRRLNPQTFTPGNRTRPLTPDEKIFWKDEKTGLVPNLVEYDLDRPTSGYFGHYKKPVQPVQYREVSKATVQPKEFINFPESKVKRTTRLPESIDSIKQDASGVNVYVTVNGKTSVIPKRDYPSWRAENKDLYDTYTAKQRGGEQLQTPQPSIRPNFFTPEQIRQARIDAAKKAPLTFEGRINEALGNPKERAADLSQKVAPKGEGPVDNIRHTVAGMYTADAIANKLSPYAIGPAAVVPKIAGFMGSNLAGLAHEVKAFIPSLEGNYRNIPATARMSAEDMINNFVGSALSLNPFMNEKEKEDLIVKMSYENYLPDGYAQIHPKHSKDLYFKKEYGGDLEEFGSGGLKQWFAEKWVDVKTGKECGRSGKDKDGRPYPACRPSKRINSTTPKTTSEMSSSEKARFKREKTSGQRISYNHNRRQLGGQMTPQGITPAFFKGMKDAAVDAFKFFMASPDQPAQPAPVDWRKMDRPGQINYGIQETVQFDAPENRKTVENLLESTAYMENKYGQDPRAYGRNYTNSFMSIDPIALKDLFTGRGQNGAYTSAQKRYLETMKSMGLPTDQKAFTELLQQDDPRAAMVAARARYILSPQALPDMNNPREMFEYWLKNYNGMGVLKHQSRNKAYQDFIKGYKMALAND